MNADIGSLKAKDAEIENLVAKKADIESLNAYRLKADKISVNELLAGNVNGHNVDWYKVPICHYVGEDYSNETINGQNMRIVHKVKPEFFTAYLLCSKE